MKGILLFAPFLLLQFNLNQHIKHIKNEYKISFCIYYAVSI